ncbi:MULTISPECIES: DUF6243 family protein [Streptomyces]|uniref:Small EDRK-rich factor-like N-terminal domain-containing protein n=1 Tax=Streptomyces rhizosphaericola TaxID=2564098 RepID=A0ABY2PG16_9ACTN|nr:MULTISPECIES: DUF6243 family protein [Streptomyces]ARI54644.1 hypothetical protein A6E92_22555 [Streptomyces sp. S8]MYT93870.1 hypothetical protein [Streptomyces sp. SID8359]MYU00458.1 hypothetical protein [Streptomyces sp. SID8350]NGO84464.1 hypothetical protein [Streptomyces sp. 196(2019)]PWS42580.1 hypothetical protein DKT74_21380 [Streptomyces sp. ZEA17I]
MAKGRNNLLGVGGQRKKLSRAEQQGAGSARVADRKVAEDKKQELVRKMRERAEAQTSATASADPAEQGGSAQS